MATKSAKSTKVGSKGTVSPKTKGNSPTSATASAKDKQASAKERREAAIRRRQQQQTILVGVVAAVVLIAVVGAILISTRPLDSEIPAEVATEYTVIAEKGYQGKTEDGFYYMGRADAPITIEKFSSFSCIHCQTFHDDYLKGIQDKIDAGHVKYIYIPLTKFGSFDSEGMSKGAYCAGEQGKYWEMSAIMFDWQTRYANSSNDSRRLAGAAAQLGLDAGKFSTCLTSAEAKAAIDKAAIYAASKGVNGTPTVYVDGTKMFPERDSGAAGISLGELRGYIEAKVGAN